MQTSLSHIESMYISNCSEQQSTKSHSGHALFSSLSLGTKYKSMKNTYYQIHKKHLPCCYRLFHKWTMCSCSQSNSLLPLHFFVRCTNKTNTNLFSSITQYSVLHFLSRFTLPGVHMYGMICLYTTQNKVFPWISAHVNNASRSSSYGTVMQFFKAVKWPWSFQS